jgi:hypothetical protein
MPPPAKYTWVYSLMVMYEEGAAKEIRKFRKIDIPTDGNRIYNFMWLALHWLEYSTCQCKSEWVSAQLIL